MIALFIIIFTIFLIDNKKSSEKDKHYPKYDKIIAEWKEQYDKFPDEEKEERICYVNENDPKRRTELLSNCIKIKSENVEIAPDEMLSYSSSGTLFSDTETVFEDSKTEETFTLNNFRRYMSDFNSENFTKEPSTNDISSGLYRGFIDDIKIIQ